MIIQLKEKHLCYALSLIQSETVGDYLTTATTVVNAIVDNEDGEDAMLTIDVSGDAIYNVYRKAGLQNEVFAQAINQEIKSLLLPQIISLGTEESSKLLYDLNELTENASKMLEDNIAQARNRVKPPTQ